jgi:anti-sigma regulatory factor (Ser/Thr protein kinase)
MAIPPGLTRSRPGHRNGPASQAATDMAKHPSRFDRMVPAAPDAIGPLRRELRRFARAHGANAEVQAAVALAFSEACASVVRPDADPLGDPGPLMVQARVRDGVLLVRVAHSGRSAPPVGEDGGYGFGLALISRLTEHFEVRDREGRPGKDLEMTFTLERATAPPRSSPLPPSRSSPRR